MLICTNDVDSFRPKRANYQPIFIVQSRSNKDEYLQCSTKIQPVTHREHSGDHHKNQSVDVAKSNNHCFKSYIL